MESLKELNAKITEEVLKSVFKENKLIFGEGKGSIVLIGEAPGGEEELKGRPFVGRAGKNLDDFLKSIGIFREELYITNAVKLRPKGISKKTGKIINRPPGKAEIEFFKPFLFEELKILNPKLIITLGNVPLKILKGDKINIGKAHGIEDVFDKSAFFPLYHPASVIYNQSLRTTYTEDLVKLEKTIVKIYKKANMGIDL